MSFRWFIYYCALFGGWAALFGWLLGRWLAPETPLVIQAGVKGVFLGLTVALGVGLVDALWVLSLRQAGQVALRAARPCWLAVSAASLAACSDKRFSAGPSGRCSSSSAGRVPACWLACPSASSRSWPAWSAARRGAARRKLLNGLIGGAVGGLLGGVLYVSLRGLWKVLFAAQPQELLWSPSAIGFVVLGVCIGLLIGLAQVVLREAWVRVEAGFRAGRELLLSKSETLIGRAESCDIGLFGDPGVEPRHARILQQGGRYLLVDADSSGGTYLNETRVTQPSPLRSGDLIRVGRSVLRFGERGRRAK